MRWVKRLAIAGLILIVLGVVGGWIWWRYTFPFGYSHACSKGLGLTLRIYAGDHDGWLPYGGPTPEASLGLIAKDDAASAEWVLGGKNVKPEVVKAALARDEGITPETCGWHYVEGLRETDDPQIAVAWDKVEGLWHNGNRRRGLMHEVICLDGSISFIKRSHWPKFVAEQRDKLAAVKASRESNAPPICWSDEATLGPNSPRDGGASR